MEKNVNGKFKRISKEMPAMASKVDNNAAEIDELRK